MGLTNDSTGRKAADIGLRIKKNSPKDRIIAVAGNPNVGKSTLFNGLTGMNQHTGNWPGKTVTNAQGYCRFGDTTYILVDIPGTYSLMAHSAEEEVARDFICFGDPDAVIVVCDATCLERNLNLVLQTIEITDRVVLCVNLMDEAEKKKIRIDLSALSERLGIPVVGTTARKKKTLSSLMTALDTLFSAEERQKPAKIDYGQPTEGAIAIIEEAVESFLEGQKGRFSLSPRWVALKLLDRDPTLTDALSGYLEADILRDPAIAAALDRARACLAAGGMTEEGLRDRIVSALVLTAQNICRDVLSFDRPDYNERDRKIDKILTGRLTGFPIMLALLAGIFWLTIIGANYPSALLSDLFFWLEEILSDVLGYLSAPVWLHDLLIFGVLRVLGWVVSVMLPPIAIFFPLFTLLEDLGYLPRVAFNLDRYFKKCAACGKQALTMCMGFGCNAAGIIGCRIIDSPRERLIAILTNNFVPCNGRFPTLIAILAMFFAGMSSGLFESVLLAVLLLCIILIGVGMTFAISKLLSKTILKGVPSSFTLELPPYRKPQIGKIVIRSIFDRTLFVLGRAIIAAIPAGLIIWLATNITAGGATLLSHASGFLDPFGRLLGMDGVILLAFILGMPANEIVVPIIIMTYMASGTLTEMDSLLDLKQLLLDNGWTSVTAMCTMLFSLMHWPCTTTCLTIKKETQSWKWTALSFLLPTVTGIVICLVFANVARIFL
ncbi:MAG: ferrous iron transport protein B [Clostridiales bacterium]|nr:ferrous iron transport protein B [Clostridiales bacterium]